MNPLIVLVACYLLGILGQQLLLYLRRRKFQQRHQCYPATKFPQYERFLGIGLMLENLRCWKAGRLLEQMRSRFDLAGYTYSATVGGIPSIFTIEPANIKAIFADKFDDFDAGWLRRRAFAPAIGDVLITSDGPRWRHQRAMLRPAFNKQQFSDYDMFEHDIDTLINRIPKDGSTIDLAPLFYTHALTLASRLLFDEPIASLNPEFADSSDRFIEAFHRVNKGNQLRLRMGRFLPIQRRDRSYEAGCEIVHEYGDAFVKRASEYRVSFGKNGVHQNDKPGDRYVFLRELAKEIEDSVELRNHLVGMLLVGSETTAGLLTGCLSVLSSRPHLWAKLHREAVDLGVPNNEAVKAFTSLSHVINEVLRLYPILPLFGRMANKDTFLPIGAGPDGASRVFVPKGTWALINTHSLHRRTDIFGGDSDEFKPERWEQTDRSSHWSYLPFGGGPRICIGQQYALMEVSYTMFRLLQVFPSIESRDSRPWLESISISLTNGNGAKVAFKGA